MTYAQFQLSQRRVAIANIHLIQELASNTDLIGLRFGYITTEEYQRREKLRDVSVKEKVESVVANTPLIAN